VTRLEAAKAWLGGLGFVLGLAGMALERHALVWVAVGLLGVAVLLRVSRRSGPA
jgi:hypothetical protein